MGAHLTAHATVDTFLFDVLQGVLPV
jgi:hypothetical protein